MSLKRSIYLTKIPTHRKMECVSGKMGSIIHEAHKLLNNSLSDLTNYNNFTVHPVGYKQTKPCLPN